jgi:cystathionine beta-synthase
LSRFFARVRPEVELVLADPAGSSLAEYIHRGKLGPGGSYAVEGIGSSSIPPVADLSRVTAAYTITDAVSFSICRDLLRHEGIFPGSSSGTLVAAALEYCRAQTRPKRVVTFICDSGNKYLSKMYNDYWMIDQGFLQRPALGDLRDLLTRRYEEGAIITVGPTDTLLTAFQRMRVADISQVPVIDNGQAVGILDESDVLVAVHGHEDRFRDPVSTAMTTKLETIAPTASLDSVLSILDKGLVALVVEDGRFLGLITRTDLLNHLRRRLK